MRKSAYRIGALMITFILLAFFFLVAILFGAVAYTSNQRARAGMSGVDPSLSSVKRRKASAQSR